MDNYTLTLSNVFTQLLIEALNKAPLPRIYTGPLLQELYQQIGLQEQAYKQTLADELAKKQQEAAEDAQQKQMLLDQ
jgi:hypothetical protein